MGVQIGLLATEWREDCAVIATRVVAMMVVRLCVRDEHSSVLRLGRVPPAIRSPAQFPRRLVFNVPQSVAEVRDAAVARLGAELYTSIGMCSITRMRSVLKYTRKI